jgi:hypothetical protein
MLAMLAAALADLRVNSLLLLSDANQNWAMSPNCLMRAYGRRELFYYALCGRELA